MAEDRPKLDLAVELVYPDNTSKRLDPQAPSPGDKPTGIQLKTQRYTGFADAQCTVFRDIAGEYQDLNLLGGFNLIGNDGSVAYEGRLGSLPRTLEGTPKIMLMGQGWMAHARDQTFVEVFVDRDISKWGAMSARRRANLLNANTWVIGNESAVNDEAGNPAIQLEQAGGWASPYKPDAEAWWLPQAGISLGALYYDFASYATSAMSTADAEWKIEAALSSDDAGTAADTTANLWSAPPVLPKTGYLTAGGTRKAALLSFQYKVTPGGGGSQTYFARFLKPAVYGTHGLTRRGEDPGGFYVSDMIQAICAKWAPFLNTSGVKETTFAVPHASFLSETLPYDAFQALNAYHRWEMAVYENKILKYGPIDLTDWDWEVRKSDPGTELSLQGDDLEHLCNGVIVRYTNLATGYEERLTPITSTALKDNSPGNPANKYGIARYTTLSLSVPTTTEGAEQIGRIYLNEFNKPKAPGQITLKSGYIRDRAGHLQPGWKARSGDRVVIADTPNAQVRVIGETDWQHDTKTLSLATDGTFQRLDAILSRLGVAVEASGLALP